MSSVRIALACLTGGGLGLAACGLIGWGFWQLVDAVGPAALFILFGIIGTISGVALLGLHVWGRRP